jgi:hypothetical protein
MTPQILKRCSPSYAFATTVSWPTANAPLSLRFAFSCSGQHRNRAPSKIPLPRTIFGAVQNVVGQWYRGKTHRCRNPTSFSTASHCCSMRRPFRTQTFRAFRRAPSRCALPLNKSLPSASSAPPPAYSFAAASSPGHLSCSTAQIPPHSAPPSLPIQSP